jgi:hypothetical protein
MSNQSQENAPIILSIKKLMDLFRESLESLIPSLEKAQITWDTFEDYEEIETISESLFDLIVRYQLNDYIKTKYNKELTLPNYGFYNKNYAGFDCIEVKTEDSEDRYVFVLVESKNGAFDTVMCDKVDDDGNIISRENEFIWDNVNFVLKLKK